MIAIILRIDVAVGQMYATIFEELLLLLILPIIVIRFVGALVELSRIVWSSGT